MNSRSIFAWILVCVAGLSLRLAIGSDLAFETLGLGCLVAFLAILFGHYFYFVKHPSLHLTKEVTDEAGTARRRRFLERLVATPSLMGGKIKFLPRYQLFLMDRVEKKYDAAIAQGRILAGLGLLPGLESDVRRRLAVPDDRTIRMTVLGNAGHAATLLGDSGRVEEFWTLYPDCNPDPAYVPTGKYYLGEALLGLGGTRLARKRLDPHLEPRRLLA